MIYNWLLIRTLIFGIHISILGFGKNSVKIINKKFEIPVTNYVLKLYISVAIKKMVRRREVGGGFK